MSSAAEERTARLREELNKPFRRTHYMQHSANQVYSPGEELQRLPEHNRSLNAGARGWSQHFQMVRNRDGHVASVGRGEISRDAPPDMPVRTSMPSEDSSRWSPEVGDNEISEWRKIFNDRREEGRRG